MVRDAVVAFESLGARVEEVTPAWGPHGPEIVRFFWSAHELAYAQYLPEWESRMDPGLVACIRAAAGTPAEAYLAMRQRKLDYVAAIHRWFGDWDLLLTPAVSVVAPVPPLAKALHLSDRRSASPTQNPAQDNRVRNS